MAAARKKRRGARSSAQIAAQKKAAEASAAQRRRKAKKAANVDSKLKLGPTGFKLTGARGTIGGVPKRYAGNKDPAIRRAAAAQRRGNFLFAEGNRTHAAREYTKADYLIGLKGTILKKGLK